MAAAFELRKYPQYADVIINICEKAEIRGAASEMLREEMVATAEFMKARR